MNVFITPGYPGIRKARVLEHESLVWKDNFHFEKWKNAYSRELSHICNLIIKFLMHFKASVDRVIIEQKFCLFAYKNSSGYISPYDD